jgi:mannan endo-1,4-beta-mannosidase
MKKFAISLLIVCFASILFAQDGGFKNFVTVQGDKLMDENGEIKFISFNIPCLHYNEDNMAFEQTNPWRLSDEFEINDALEAVRQMGGQVIRTYTLSVRCKGEDPNIPRHITAPGEFNEEAFKTLDIVLAAANKKGIRVIIPILDNWKWWGGVQALADFRNKSTDSFWTDKQLFDDFKDIVVYLANRTNTITGVKYKDDKTILAWETGNELTCPAAWTAKAAALIKSVDQNHLVIDGYHSNYFRDESLADANVDILTTHHYSTNAQDSVHQIKKNAAKCKDKKPYFIGEFGFLPTKDIRTILNTVIEQDTSGALIWSLRFRNRDGGFYWHHEPLGGDLFKAYHWPGFESGSAYDEKNLMGLMRSKAFAIRNMKVPDIEIPAAPVMLDILDNAHISFQGSAGAESYIVERATEPNGTWTVAGDNVSDSDVQYRPLFNDINAPLGKGCYYRVKAKNIAGVSEASNVVGPVYIRCKTLVDEMRDLSKIKLFKGKISFENNLARKFKEDSHRIAGSNNSSIVYRVDEPIISFKVFAFFPGKINDFKFYVSENGKKYTQVKSESQSFAIGKGDYNYEVPVLFTGAIQPANDKYLKIEFTGKAQLSRVEIKYGAEKSKFSHKYSPTGFIKGFTWGWTGWRGQYLGDAPADSMKKLAETKTEWVCISFGADMEKPDIPHIQWGDNYQRMATDAEIRRAIQLARDNNLKIVFKPVVNVYDGTWRAWIKFNDLPGQKNMAKWNMWWSDFRAFLIHYAKIAEETKCEMLCLGCEMESTEEFEIRWRNLITEIRQIYGGPITYNLNHGREKDITWLDAVDIIGVSAYYPVGTDDVLIALKDDLSKIPGSDTSVAAQKRRWIPIRKDLEKTSKKFDRPIFFIELGLCSAKGCAAAPWTHEDPNMIYDADEQARFYQAAFETFWDEPWFIGFAWWEWSAQLYKKEDAGTNIGFGIYGKPAEETLRQWYGKDR